MLRIFEIVGNDVSMCMRNVCMCMCLSVPSNKNEAIVVVTSSLHEFAEYIKSIILLHQMPG